MMDTAAFCANLVRQQDPDRYFAGLFAPADRRAHLFSLYAFNAEIARIPELVSEPIPGEIRLTWWREVIEGQRNEEAGAHPVASAIRRTIADNRLPVNGFIRLIEARIFDLYDDPMPTVADLEGYAGDTSSALIRLASIILAKGKDPGAPDAAGHAGVAYAVTGMLRALPYHASRGQVLIPAEVMARYGARREDILHGRATPHVLGAIRDMRDLARRHLEAARQRKGTIRREIDPAFLPVALCDRYLAAMERRGYDPLRVPLNLPQWRRQAALWLAARRGKPLG